MTREQIVPPRHELSSDRRKLEAKIALRTRKFKFHKK